MKKVLFSVLFIAMVAAMIGAGTWAYFSDYEYVYDNCWTAGTLDLKVNGENDETLDINFDEVCVAPCDFGQLEVTLTNDGCVDGMLDFKLFNLRDWENGCNEPELEGCSDPVGCDPDPTCNNPGLGEGELSQYMWMEVWADCTGGTSYDTEVIKGFVKDLENDKRYFCDCINDGEAVGLKITWEVDCEVGNIIQSDSICFDIEFSLEQKPCEGECCLNVTGFDQPEGVVLGNSYDFDVYVQAEGDMACSGTINAHIEDGGGATVWNGSAYVSELMPPGTTTKSFSWTPTAVGSYTVVASGTCEANVEECPFTVMEPGALVVTDIDQPQTAQICEPLTVTVHVENQGGVAAEGTLIVVVDDDGMPPFYYGPAFFLTGSVPPGGYVDIPVNIAHVDEAWRGLAGIGAGFHPEGLDFYQCGIAFLMPPTFEVVNIQQPDVVQPCEDFQISVDVHNTGDKPGECGPVTLFIEKDTTIIWGPVQVTPDPPTINACETRKVEFGWFHVPDDLPADLGDTLNVFAQAPDTIDPYRCDIDVVGGPCIVVEGIQQPEEVSPCDSLMVSVDVHNAGGKPGECTVECGVWDVDGGVWFITPTVQDVPLLNPCDRQQIDFDFGHVDETWPRDIEVVAQACCGDPYRCPITVVKPVPPTTYYTNPETSYMCLAYQMNGDPEDITIDPPAASPAMVWFDMSYGDEQSGSTYRELTIDKDSFYWFPLCANETAGMLQYVTINVKWSDTAGDGTGKLYTEVGGASPAPDDGDVDYHSEVYETGPVVTWGNASNPNLDGSAYVHCDIVAEIWSSPTQGDPCDSGSWGAPVLNVPLDLYMTTGQADCHMDEDGTNGNYENLNCHTVPDPAYSVHVPLVGAEFAETGGDAPYCGTPGTMVGATGGVDLKVFGFVEIDFQVEFYWELSDTPLPDPCP
jgi:predicted ribosomally synthesized peptide with SipW-like signal peptide